MKETFNHTYLGLFPLGKSPSGKGMGIKMSDIIQVTDLKKAYGRRAILKGLSFRVKRGEIFALLGINGAGKTTTLECMEGLKSYDSGSITINGKMGIQMQSSSLPESMKAIEAVQLFAKWNKAVISQAMLDTLGIRPFAKKKYNQLSTGQKRRLHLALALIGDPDIVFLDEPTAGLDVEGRISLHEQIRQLRAQEKTVILASHDLAEIETLCDRIAILNDGMIGFLGTVEELTTSKIGKHYTISVKTPQGDEKFESDSIADTLLMLLLDYQKKGTSILDVQINRDSLEQCFMKIAKGE